MLRFFSKIRYQLAAENKPVKYMRYAIGEIVLVVIGILIALQVNNWNQKRILHIEEVDVISRFINDIQMDLNFFERRMKKVKEKEESLQNLKSVFTNGQINDTVLFLKDIIIGSNFGWNQGTAHSSTYDDLVSSGKLGLIKDSKIRLTIADYYGKYKDQNNRMDARETKYPELSYQLIPREMPTGDNISTEFLIDSSLTKEQLNDLIELVESSSLRDYVIAEINLARFIYGVTINIQEQAEELLNSLKEYYKEIQ